MPCSRTQNGLTQPLVFQVYIRDVATPCVLVRFVPFGCDFSIYRDPISYDRVARSDKITYVRIWNIPIEYRIIMIRAPDLAPSNTCRSIHLDTLQHVHHVPVRSGAVLDSRLSRSR